MDSDKWYIMTKGDFGVGYDDPPGDMPCLARSPEMAAKLLTAASLQLGLDVVSAVEGKWKLWGYDLSDCDLFAEFKNGRYRRWERDDNGAWQVVTPWHDGSICLVHADWAAMTWRRMDAIAADAATSAALPATQVVSNNTNKRSE